MIIIIIISLEYYPRGTEIPGWCPAWDTVSHGQVEGLDGNLPRNGVSIKTLVVVTPHQHRLLINEIVIEYFFKQQRERE